MCGFAGCLGARPDAELLQEMGAALHHRGPDDGGIWSDADAGVGFSFRRLAILDLSTAGRQPMHSPSGRYVIVFNGEIYNHLDVRRRLEHDGNALAWRGHSDTETLLAGFEAWGIHRTIERTTGMFAAAIWDKKERTLTLTRDRIGEKPLYYGWQQGVLLFGSELKALRVHPAFVPEIDRGALALLMRHNYIPAPHSIYQGIRKLLPGTLLTISLREQNAEPRPYWNASEIIRDCIAHPFEGSPDEAIDALDAELRRAVRAQMIADVPLGAFLSGGVDSSAIVAIMQQISDKPVRTFSIGFKEERYNEAIYSKTVAAHLGTDHTELYVSPQDALDVIPLLPSIYCEPFSDSSQIPTYLVSRLARQQVTVSLSGDGGDELFAGYTRYVLSNRFWKRMSVMPASVRRTAARWIARVPAPTWNHVLRPARHFFSGAVGENALGDRMIRGAEVLGSRDEGELYRLLVSHWTEPEKFVLGAHEPKPRLNHQADRPLTDNFVHEMMAMDLVTYLPDDILAKVDRAAMAVSLETRVPLLDHKVVELAWRFPLDYKLHGNASKWPLRRVLYRYVPRELIERPKMGFGVPIDNWLRGPLRDWAEDLLSEARLAREGYFDPSAIREKWNEHVSGRRNWHYHLWDVLVFQCWLSSQGSGPVRPESCRRADSVPFISMNVN